MKNRRVFIPSSVLPHGSKRITNADGDRVWLINGQEFESKRAYFRYLQDKALMERVTKSDTAAPKLEPDDLKIVPIDKSHDATAAPQAESTAPKLEPIKSGSDG